ncbi:MAG: hypothetical protein UZ01_02874 [Candidatus Brocadia sinica]|nr:MAG: hypothetical protein UZ01_02874 [Candidatus Brocadia sinica]
MTAMHLLYKKNLSTVTYPATAPMNLSTGTNLPHPFRTSPKNDPLTSISGGVLNFVNIRYWQIITCKVKGSERTFLPVGTETLEEVFFCKCSDVFGMFSEGVK